MNTALTIAKVLGYVWAGSITAVIWFLIRAEKVLPKTPTAPVRVDSMSDDEIREQFETLVAELEAQS